MKKIKILVSSKYLNSFLSVINFDYEIEWIKINKDKKGIILHSNGISYQLDCQVSEYDIVRLNQEYRRWDWVKTLVNNIDEQPVILEISKHVINVILQY